MSSGEKAERKATFSVPGLACVTDLGMIQVDLADLE